MMHGLASYTDRRNLSCDGDHKAMGQGGIRGILSRLKQTFTFRLKDDRESTELDLYRDEFAPDDPVLVEIRDAIRAREAARKKPPRGSSAA
jgi:hypothetical protein